VEYRAVLLNIHIALNLEMDGSFARNLYPLFTSSYIDSLPQSGRAPGTCGRTCQLTRGLLQVCMLGKITMCVVE